MEHGFWRQKWQSGEINFHKTDVHPMLVRHFSHLSLAPGARVFVPLCGKTLDIGWLLARGMAVVGVELSALAIDQLFDELSVEPKITQLDKLIHYSADNIDIFVGDIFDVSADLLGHVDVVYDRAALVALRDDTRRHYAEHITAITARAQQLLISFEYDDNSVSGPPFPVSGAQIARLYPGYRSHEMLETQRVDGLKGVTPAHELIWHMRA